MFIAATPFQAKKPGELIGEFELSNNINTSDNNDVDDGDHSHSHLHENNMISHHCTSSQSSVTMGTSSNNKSNSKSDRLKDCIEHSVSDKAKKKISVILHEVEQLNDVEKLLLYLQLPNGSVQDADPMKQGKGHGNAFGKKADIEVSQTYNWIKTHLEEDSTVSLPKHEVYEEYRQFCTDNKFEPLCVADFGKAMKSIFPRVKPRRLGQRGNSKYCYSGLRKRHTIEPPELPVLDTSGCAYDFDRKSDVEFGNSIGEGDVQDKKGEDQDVKLAACHLIIEWAHKLLGCHFDSIIDLGKHLVDSKFVDEGSVAAYTVISSSMNSNNSNNNNNNNQSNSCFQEKNSNSPRIHLQRKLQEKEKIKEQKKKLEQIKSPSNKFNQNGINFPNNKNKKNKRNSISKIALSQDTNDNSNVINDNVIVKKEPQTEPELSPVQQVLQGQHLQLVHNTRPQNNKVPIPRTGTPSRLTSQSAIILLPTTTVKITSPQPNHETLTTTTVSMYTPTSPNKLSTSTISAVQKYKKIQPKPVCINRSDSESAVSLSSNDSINNSDFISTKRRHSVSVPFQDNNNMNNNNNNGTMKIIDANCLSTDKQAQFNKRHIDEKDNSNSNNKKRMISNSTNKVAAKLNTNGIEDANSSNSLSPLSQAELQAITSNFGFDTSDIGIQEIESDALMDSFISNLPNQNNDNWENHTANAKSDQWSQLRKLLEKNLPKVVTSKACQRPHEGLTSLEGFPELREAILKKNFTKEVQIYEHLKSQNDNLSQQIEMSNNFNVNKSKEFDGFNSNSQILDNFCLSMNSKGVPSMPLQDVFASSNAAPSSSSTIYANVQVQVPSVPPSPNARRRAFNFQPISPRNTPTIPENSTLDNGFSLNYCSSRVNNTTSTSPQYRINQHTVAVGPSQPPSEANSPFVSPRSTPVPLSRSRHNSGQSNYTLRQTPLQNFDSGVSSISSSPFISPQTTPVPISRVKTCTNVVQRNRARHSSGPGGPCTGVSQIAANFLNHRSNSLSPMIGDGFMGQINQSNQTFIFADVNSQTNFPIGTNDMNFSANSILKSELYNNKSNKLGSSDLVMSQTNELFQKDWQQLTHLKGNILSSSSSSNRHRHSSNPINPSALMSTFTSTANVDQYSHEITNYLKNVSSDLGSLTVIKPSLLNRCQSVPVHQMIQTNYNYKNNNDLSPNDQSNLCVNLFDENVSVSKSYPATPICNENFQFPPSPPSSTKHQNVIAGEDISGNVLQSGQDVMVSGMQITVRDASSWSNTIGSSNSDNELMGINTGPSSSARRNLNDLLTEPQDADLQATIEDLNDIIACDDFTNLAHELEDNPNCFDNV